MRVLHVTDCWLAGVATAITGWIEATPQLEHVVLGRGRAAAADQTAARPRAATWIDLPPGPVRAAAAVTSAIRTHRPDVVHAHSSRAGVAVRLGRAPAIVYSPHGFGFMRTDLSPPWRSAVRAVEAGLARRRQTIVACCDHERESACRLGAPHVVTVPYALPHAGAAAADGVPPGRRTVALMGRVCPQKGVDFAADVAARLVDRPDAPDVVWIGGGDEKSAGRLRQAGVRVTGWLDRDRALERLAAADVYVHTAAWEGCPLTVLEALRAGVPVVARSLAALDGLPVVQRPDPASLAATVVELLDATGDRPARRPPWSHAPEEVGARLVDVYRRAATR